MGKTTTASRGRQSNIELLRIFAMIMIIAHHVAIHSDFAFTAEAITANRLWIQFLQVGGKVGVNVFVLISGYFSVTATSFKPSKVAKLWLQILTYSVGLFCLAVLLLGEPITAKGFLKNTLPITYSNWWFASAYFVLYLLSPYLNIWFRAMDKRTYTRLLIIMTFCWSIIPTLLSVTWQGNALIWFIYLYALAGYLRVHMELKRVKAVWCLLGSAATMGCIFLSAVAFDVVGLKLPFLADFATYFYDMTRVPALVAAVLLFIGFLKLPVGSSSFINVVSSATFGVYLIHDNHYVRDFLWNTLFRNGEHTTDVYLVAYTLMQVVAVYAVCTLAELIRRYGLERWYEKPLVALEQKLKTAVRALAQKRLSK